MAAVVGTATLAVGAGALLGAPAGAAVPEKSTPKAKIEVGDNFFEPDEVEIAAGTKVVWKNEGKILHNVTPVKGDKWGTKALAKGKSYAFKFKKPGKYAYYCSFHGSPGAGQHGVIVVTKPAPPTTTTTSAG
jgi:plastocyanin